jgi:hypothetical protein
MINLLDYPVAIAVLSGLMLSASAWIGTIYRKHLLLDDDARQHEGLLIGATLGLLSLVIGFTLSMGVGRYDLRKSHEAKEANAIGTEYLRIDLLPNVDQPKMRALLSSYLDERIRFYVSRNEQELAKIAVRTAQLKTEMWSAVSRPAMAQPSAVAALAVAGMNEVLDDQGYTEAAWENRLPFETWGLMLTMGMFASAMFGSAAPRTMPRRAALVVLPGVIAIAFFLIADIDSPRRGLIRVHPQNLLNLAVSFHPSAAISDALPTP